MGAPPPQGPDQASARVQITLTGLPHDQQAHLLRQSFGVIENEHQPSQLHLRWPVVKQLLEQAGWCRHIQVAKGGTLVLPTVKPSERLAC